MRMPAQGTGEHRFMRLHPVHALPAWQQYPMHDELPVWLGYGVPFGTVITTVVPYASTTCHAPELDTPFLLQLYSSATSPTFSALRLMHPSITLTSLVCCSIPPTHATRVDIPPCTEPGVLHLLLLNSMDTCSFITSHQLASTPSPIPSIQYLASLPVLPPAAAAEAHGLLLKQVAAAPVGAHSALRILESSNSSDSLDSHAIHSPLADLPPPGVWPLLPTKAQLAISWAWQQHFAPWARDMSYALAGPGPAGARATLLSSLLRFSTGCGMTNTALHLLHTCARGGVIKLVDVHGDGAAGPASEGSASSGVFYAGFGGLGFVVNAGSHSSSARSLRPSPTAPFLIEQQLSNSTSAGSEPAPAPVGGDAHPQGLGCPAAPSNPGVAIHPPRAILLVSMAVLLLALIVAAAAQALMA